MTQGTPTIEQIRRDFPNCPTCGSDAAYVSTPPATPGDEPLVTCASCGEDITSIYHYLHDKLR